MSPNSIAAFVRPIARFLRGNCLAILTLVGLTAVLPAVAHAQGTIHPGEMATGAISPVGDADTWTFSANVGDAIVLRVGKITQSGAFTPRLRLFSPSSALLLTSYGAFAAEVAYTASSNGTYTVIVDDLAGTSATGTYRLTLAQTGAAITVSGGDQGGPLTNGVMHTGTIDLGDLDVWTIDATAGDAIVVRMGEIATSETLAPQLRLYSPTGTLLSTSYSAYVAEVAASAPVTGTYLLIAGDYASSLAGTGDYRLTLAKTGAPVTVSPGDQGGPLTNGAMHTGTIDNGDLDLWTIDATAGDAIVVRMGEIASSETLAPQLRLYSPTGTLLGTSYSAYAAEVAVNAPLTGTYLLIAGDYASSLAGTGDYRLTLAKTGAPVTVSPGDQGGPLTNGAMHTGTIDNGDLDLWTIDATAGDAIVVRMGEIASSETLAPQLRLYSPTGTLLGTSYSAYAAEVAVNAPLTGTYLLIAGDYASSLAGTGDYRLTLAKTGAPVTVSPGDQGGPLTNGAMHMGTIDNGDLDAWTIDATAGDAIVVRMGQLASSETLSPQLRLYSPTGTLLSTSYSAYAAEVVASAPVTGTYLLIAGDFASSLAGTGDYRLTLAKTGAPVTVSPGDQGGPLGPGNSLGTIDVGDLDLWTLNATAGQSLIVTCEEVVVGSALTPQLRLYSPAGVLLKTSYGASWTQVTASAPVSGTYLVVVGDYSSSLAGSGGYRLTPSATTGADDAPLPKALALAPAAPNPFVSRTVLHYDLPAATPVAMRLYDAQGRLVRTLVEPRTQEAGRYSVAWDGMDEQGRGASPGLYFARLDAGGRREMQKVMLSR